MDRFRALRHRHLVFLSAVVFAPALTPLLTTAADGPLRIHPKNPRYFADGSGKAVYLTGSHTWNNLVDMDRDDPPDPFDFDAYLDFLERHGHNFIRLWAWDSTVWDTKANGSLGKDFVHHVAPLPWQRTGPGKALDGKPKFDLEKLDAEYFKRLRDRVSAADRRDIYVSVMLFEGWGLMHGNQGRAAPEGWAWRNHPFNPANNINDLHLDDATETKGRIHRVGNKSVNDLQAAYIWKVVDTVNEFDNVLFEVINEGGEKEWDRWVIETIREAEREKPKQHPVGLTGHGAERLESMLSSSADWVSPGRVDGYAEDPPVWDARHKKPSLLDTDHVWGVGGNAQWVWKSLFRGHNPIFMDPYDGAVLGPPGDERWEPIRRAMGQARRLASRVDLATLTPQPDLASTRYALANSGTEYLVYQPAGGGAFTVELEQGSYHFEWTDPETMAAAGDGTVDAAGGAERFQAPKAGAAVLHLRAVSARDEGKDG